MDARHAIWLEAVVDTAAAAVLAAAVGFALVRLGWSSPTAGALAAAALLGCRRVLGLVDRGSPKFPLAPFDPVPLPAPEPVEELILGESDRLDRHQVDDELVLDDVVARLEDLSRVVRLFDRSAMPTPEELKSRIDRHLDGTARAAVPPDASQALHDALSELRRTLR